MSVNSYKSKSFESFEEISGLFVAMIISPELSLFMLSLISCLVLFFIKVGVFKKNKKNENVYSLEM